MINSLIKVYLALIIIIEIHSTFCTDINPLDSNCNVTYAQNDIIIDYINNQSVNCINNIIAPNGHRILITILQLDIPQQINGHSNCKNHLSFSPVTPTESRILKLCGQTANISLLEPQKQIISFNSSLTFQFDIEHHMSFNLFGFRLRVQFVEMCQNVIINANNSQQSYCSQPNYYISYSNDSEVCLVEVNAKSDEKLELKFTKVITSQTSPTIGHLCKTQYIELSIDGLVYNICGNWTQKDLSSMPTYISENSSIILRIYSSNNEQHITDSLDSDNSLGFCISFRTISEELCLPSKGWFDANDYCYKVFHQKKNWFEAEDYCKSIDSNANLASITSQKTQKFLDEYLLNLQNKSTTTLTEYSFWIGGSDTQFENNYQWVDGHTFHYTNWFPGWSQPSHPDNYGAQPSDDGFSQQNCIEIRNKFYLANKGKGTTQSFYWNDISCLVSNAFICQIPKTKETAQTKSDGSLSNTTCNKEIILTSYYPWDVISTPNYPYFYPNNLNCTIKVYAIGDYNIELLFTDFLIEEGGESCSYDYVMIDDWVNVRKYCGDWSDRIKLLRRSISSNITINIFTDSSHTQRGFRAELRLISKPTDSESVLCDNQRFRHFSSKCYLVSTYPEVSWQTAHRICNDIQSELININSITDESAFISLLLDNGIEKGTDLSRTNRAFWLQNDNIKYVAQDSWFFDNTDTQNDLIGTDSYNRKTCLIATIDRLSKHKLIYNRVECNSQAGYVCVKQAFDSKTAENKTFVNQTEGVLYSPNYPNSYFNQLFYTTTVKTNLTNPVIIVWFETIDIEWQKNCLYDYLIIKDINNQKTICGQINDKIKLFNKTFISKTNQISVTFNSDFSNRGNGFKLNWKAFTMNWCDLSQTIIKQSDNQTDNFIESPGYPFWNLPNLNCSLVINAETQKQVLLTIEDFDLEDFGEEFCKFDNILILDLGQSKTLQLCGSLNSRNILKGQQFISYGNSVKVHYITSSSFDSLRAKRGFRFGYKYVERDDKILSIIELPANHLGKVANLNYPHNCPNDFQIYLKSEISHQIELRLPRLTYMKINDGLSCEFIDDRLLFHVIDPFGDTSLTPPNPNIWSVCSESSEPFKTFSALKSTNIKVIKSKFNILNIKLYNNENNLLFMFYYKTKKDIAFFNNSINIAPKLPVNSCEYNPCINSGSCVTTYHNESHCQCPQLWTGIFCHLTLCNSRPCGDHGVCELNTDSSSGYICHCDSGYIGMHCENTISPCTKSNPCGERGSCSLINGVTKCKCHPWYEGIHCERFAFKIQYKPLSKKMLEEPFWLGLICVATVLTLLSIVYCIKKKFAERIEAFFAEEIEKSKSNYSIPRYSLTSNVGVNLNISPVNISPLPRSRSTFMTRLRKHKMRRSSNMNHFSDSEAVNADQFSDAEGGYHPIPSFIRHASSARDNVYDSKDETSRILQSLVGSGTQPKNRRLSLDEFIQNNSRIKMHKMLKQTIDQSTSDVSLSDGESSFISSAKSPSSSPGRRSPVNLLRQFSAISEASQEDQCSRVTSRNNTLPGDSSSDSISFLQTPVMKQESETELLLNGILSIQRASHHNLYDIDNPQPSTSGYNNKQVINNGFEANQTICRQLQEKFISSTSSTSSGASTPNHFMAPAITITDVAIEHHNQDSDNRVNIHSPLLNRASFCAALAELNVPVQTIRRLSEPSANPNDDGKRSPSPGSQSCGSPMIKKTIESTKGRKFSLEMVPKIQINTDKVLGDPNVTPNPCLKSMSYLNPMAINASSDRTISESNLSTSGYSSFSSPGISRCNSSSPFPEEIGGVNAELTTIIIPDVPQMEFKQKQGQDFRGNYGNFLSIPVFTFPTKDNSEKSRHHRPKTPINCNSVMICPEIKISPAESDERLSTSAMIVDEGIDVDIDFARESKESLKYDKNFVSIELQSRPDRLLDGRRKKKFLPSPTHSLEEFNIEPIPKIEDRLRAPKIRRNPSWPAVAIHNSSSSSDLEDNKTKQNKKNRKQYLTTKVKRFHKRRLKTRSRSQAESSFSVNSPMTDNCLLYSSKSGKRWFQPSSRSSSTESFLSTNEDENTVISHSKSRRQHISSQSLFEPNCDIFNTTSDSDSLAQNRQKQTIASISDTALDKTNASTLSFETNQLLLPVSHSLESRKRSKRRIQKQKAMQEEDQMSA